MLKVRLSFKSILCFLIVFCLLITNDQNVVNAIQQNSYSYLSRGLKRPDLITYNEAKAKKHIRRLPEKEDEYTFVFENMDGTLTSYTYGTKVQVKNGSGALQEIDLDVREEKDKSGKITCYKQTGNGYKAKFPSELTDESGVRLETEDGHISMSPLRNGNIKANRANAKTGKVKDYNGKVTYKDVFGNGADIELYTTLSGVKEDIVLKKAPTSNIFEFLISAPGLNPTVTENGAVEFYDVETLALRFRIPQAYAKDAYNGPRIEGDGHYTESIKVSMTPTDNGEWIYRLELEEEFLFGKDTVYPVVIDPSMLSITGAANQDDAYVNQANPNTNYNPNTFMCVGRDSTLLACRTYVKYNLATLLSKDALAITSAEYRVYEYAGYTSDCTVRIYRVANSWSSSTITWNIQNSFTRYSITSLNVDGAGWYYFNVKSMVNSWYLNAKGGSGYANNGFAMISDQESLLRYRKFYSSESSTNPPYLIMDYSYVDRTAPNPPTNLMTSFIKKATYDGSAQLKLNWTAATDLPNPGGSGIKNYILKIKNSSGATLFTKTDVSASATSYTTTAYYPDNSTYKFELQAVDNAKEVNGTYINNTSTAAIKYVYVSDCLKPIEISSSLTPLSSTSNPTNATSLTLGWIVSDESSLYKMEYWIGSGSHSIYYSPAKTDNKEVSISGLSTGSYTLYYQFTDVYGNASSVYNKSFTVDRTLPLIYSMFSTNIVGDSFLLPLTFTDNYALDEAVLEYGIGTSPSGYTQISTEALIGVYDTWSPEISTEGWSEDQYYTIRVKVKDKAGNWNNTFTRPVIKSGEGITIPAALVVDPIPETLTTPTVQINHNRRTSMYSDVLINGTNFGYFSVNSPISVPVNKPDLAEGQSVDLVIRSNVFGMIPAEYNVDRQQRAYIHEMSSIDDLALTNTIIDSYNGVLKLATGYTEGEAVLTVPTEALGKRIDSIRLDALYTIPSGSGIQYYIYDPLTESWVYTLSGAWYHFNSLVDFTENLENPEETKYMQIKVVLTGSTSPQLSLLKVTYNDLDMAPARRIKLLPDVTGVNAIASGTSSIDLSWNACPQVGGISPVYNVYRDETTADFIACEDNKIFTGLTTTAATDTGRAVNETYYYKVIPSYPNFNYNGSVYLARAGMSEVQSVNAIIPDLSANYATTGRLPFRQDAGIEVVAGDAFTDLKTGNFNYLTTDLTLPGWQIDMNISRNYNSTLSQSGILGSGWRLGLTQELSEYYTGDPSILEKVTYIDHYGTIWEFDTPIVENGITTFTAIPGCPYELTMENGFYTINDGAGLLYQFDSSLKLSKVETEEKPRLQECADDINGGVGSVTVSDTFGAENWMFTAEKDVNGNITGFTPVQGSPFTLAYTLGVYILSETANPSNTYSFEANDTQVHDETLELTSDPFQGLLLQPSELIFEYDVNGYLDSVSDRRGHSIGLGYDLSGKLTGITDNEGRELLYEYTASGKLQKVSLLDHYDGQTPIYAETVYNYDANGFLASISNPDSISDTLSFDSTGKITGHSSLYSIEDNAGTLVKWRSVTCLDHITGSTTLRRQMQRFTRALLETVDTLTDTVRLGKTVYTISSATGLVSSETIHGKAVLNTGEDGLEEEDYTYPVLRTGSYSYSDTDEDDLVDSIKITYTDTSTPAATLETENYLPGTQCLFSEGYFNEREGIVDHYDLAGRLEYSCHDYANHGTQGHVCESYTYTLAGRTVTQMSKYGLVTQMQYDQTGEVCSTVYPDGHVSANSRTFVYDPQNPGGAYFSTVETDYGMDYTKESRYDCLGQLMYEDIQTAGEWLSLSYTYNDLGLNLTRTDSAGNATSYAYDGHGRTLTETTDQVTGPDLVTAYTYNLDGEILTETDPYGNTVTYVYETYFDKRLLSKTTVVNGETTVEEYDYLLDENNEYTLTTTYPDNTQTVTKLNDDGQASSIYKTVTGLANAAGLERTFNYGSGQLDSMGHNGFDYIFTYNEDGELSEIAVSDGVNTQTLIVMTSTEDAYGNTADNTTYTNGQAVIKTTDSSGRAKKIEYYNGSITETKYEYAYSSEDTSPNDLDGQEITTITDHVNGQTITHSKAADEYSFTRETVVKDTATLAQIYAHTVLNTEDDITFITEISGTTQPYIYIKDASGRLSGAQYTLPGGGASIEKTDSFGGFGELTGSVTEIDTQALLSLGYTYRTVSGTAFTGQVAQETLQHGTVSKAYNYTYDDNGNITKITKTTGGVTTDVFRYVYDEAGQIIREDNVPNNTTYTWQYDKGGNIVSRKYYMLVAEGVTPGTPLITQPYIYSTGPWKDLLTSYNGQSITYDTAGNPITYMGKTLGWTMGRQLASYTNGSTTTTYKYNDAGIRAQKANGTDTTDYVLNGTQILAQTTNGTRTDFRYDGNGKLIAIRYNGTEYYYVTNILGDVTGIVDSTGTSVVEYNYDAWGKNLFTTGTLATTLGQANPFRYRGYYFDTESGLYYLQSRYYDPNTGRFINADDTSILQMTQGELLGGNLYAYCGNCPVMNVDPSGYIVSPLWLSLPSSNFTLRSVPICSSRVLKAIKLTKWNTMVYTGHYVSMRVCGSYQIYSFQNTRSLYSYYIYDFYVRSNSYDGWLSYLRKKYGWSAKLFNDIFYGLGLLDSIYQVDQRLVMIGKILSSIYDKFKYISKEEKYIIRMLSHYTRSEKTIYIVFYMNHYVNSANRKYLFWGPIVGWRKTFLFRNLLPY